MICFWVASPRSSRVSGVVVEWPGSVICAHMSFRSMTNSMMINQHVDGMRGRPRQVPA